MMHDQPNGHSAQPVYDVDKIRADFPILSRQVNGKPLVYLDRRHLRKSQTR